MPTIMTPLLTFFVPGTPEPAGSKRAFYVKSLGRAVVTDANAKSKPWQAEIKGWALQYWKQAPLDCAISLTLTMTMSRPSGHYNARGEVRLSARQYPTTRPDALKLARAVEDALTGIVWRDDSQIVDEHLYKRYGGVPGCKIEVGVP